MDWRRPLVWLGLSMICAVITCCFWIVCSFVVVATFYVLLLVALESTFLFLLLNGMPTTVILYYTLGMILVGNRLSGFVHILIRYDLKFQIVYSMVEPFGYLIADILCEQWRKFRAQRRAETSDQWTSISSTPFLDTWTRRFFAATVCSSSEVDDPFWPDHVSIVHVVEIQRHSEMWAEVSIWRVSTLHGRTKKLHSVHALFLHLPGSFQIGNDVKCFESDGLIGVFFARSTDHESSVLYLYDTRYNKWASYQCGEEDSSLHVSTFCYVAMSCLERLHSQKGAVEGWKIRLIHGDDEVDWAAHLLRARLVNSVLELRETARLVNQEEIMANEIEWSSDAVVVRSGNCLGVYWDEDRNDGPVVLYDLAAQRYVCTTLQSLLENDPRFATTVSNALLDTDGSDDDPDDDENGGIEFEPDVAQQAINDQDESDDSDDVSIESDDSDEKRMYLSPLCPIVLNHHECIKFCKQDGSIYRKSFIAPTMKYLAAKAFFQSFRGLWDKMDSETFRRLTGIASMQPHLTQHRQETGIILVYGSPEVLF